MSQQIHASACETLNQSGTACPAETCADEKKRLRKEKTALRKSIAPDVRVHADARINELILSVLPPADSYDTLAGYITDGSEPDVSPVLRAALSAGKTLCLPRFKDSAHYDFVSVRSLDFSQKKFGIPEPDETAQVVTEKDLENAVWLVPGVAFDDACGRLGRGKGVYDRLLSCCKPKLAIGIFYECQKCSAVPLDPHDQPLDAIVTEEKIYGRRISGVISK